MLKDIKKRGKLTARDRIELLIDKGSHFLEFSELAAYGMYGGGISSAGFSDRRRGDP